MTKVFTLAPAFFPMQKDWLGSALWSPESGNTVTKISYPNIPLLPNTRKGRDNLNTVLEQWAYDEPVIVGGHSQGGQVIAMWCRDIGWDSDIPAENITFYITGNLERKYNGRPKGGDYPGVDEQSPGVRYSSDPGGTGMPEDIKYRVYDIAKQWDGWADCPDDLTNTAAMDNAQLGKKMNSCHVQYNRVSLSNPDNLSHTEGQITYILAPTYPLPIAAATYKSSLDIYNYHIDHVDEIEEAYSRPYGSLVEQPGPPELPPIPSYPEDIPVDYSYIDRRVYDLVGDSV